MNQIETNIGKILVVEVPEDTTWWEIIDNDLGDFITKKLNLNQQFLQYGKKSTILGKEINNQVYYNPNNFYLPKGKHRILGKLSELEDEELERFIENDNDGAFFGEFWEYTGPKNYVAKGTDWKICNSIKESFISLLQSNVIDTSKELLILEVL